MLAALRLSDARSFVLTTRLHEKRYWREYGAAFERIAEDPTVRVIVVSSALEKAFSAGVDRALRCVESPPRLVSLTNPPLHSLRPPRNPATHRPRTPRIAYTHLHP